MVDAQPSVRGILRDLFLRASSGGEQQPLWVGGCGESPAQFQQLQHLPAAGVVAFPFLLSNDGTIILRVFAVQIIVPKANVAKRGREMLERGLVITFL